MVKTNVLEEIGKKILFIAPHPDDDVIGCGALLLELSKLLKKGGIHSIHVIFSVSGFIGVSDRFMRSRGFDAVDEVEKRAIKSKIRREESTACCNYLGAQPIFLNLPFYEKQGKDFKKHFTQEDVKIAASSIDQIKPDSIFLIDEMCDPHGTHGIVRDLFFKVLQEKRYAGALFGYQVWKDFLQADKCDKIICFDEEVMQEKIKLISFHQSQLQDPAYPCEHKDFIELAKIRNSAMAKKFCTKFSYAECYKNLPKEI